MKNIYKHTLKKRRTINYLLVLIFFIFPNCESQSVNSFIEENQTTEYSKYDGNPIIEINENEFLGNSKIELFKKEVINRFGSELINEVDQQVVKAKSNNSEAYSKEVFLLNDFETKNKSVNKLSTHFRIIGENGKSEEFLFGIRKYKELEERLKTDSSSDVWLALDPDKFYLEDDPAGEEIWPIELEALHISDNDRKLKLTFDQSGLVSAKEVTKFKSTAVSDPNILFLDAVPVIAPCVESATESCTNPGGGGSGSGSSNTRINDWSRGESTGTGTGNPSTYFVLKSVRLVETGDAGTSELQMFTKKSNSNLINLPVSYKYRFDDVIRITPYLSGQAHTLIQGADRGGYRNAYYAVPDINNANQTYSFQNTVRYTTLAGGIPFTSGVDYFPLFNLTQTSGPWRFVLVDDDKDYADFSSRRKSTRVKDIHTYDMGSGTWGLVETGFTTRNHRYGSSDDPITQSGVRNITQNNAFTRIGYGEGLEINKWYGNKLFAYKFGLESYVIY